MAKRFILKQESDCWVLRDLANGTTRAFETKSEAVQAHETESVRIYREDGKLVRWTRRIVHPGARP